MTMNMYLVQTVSSRPRPWSSYTNINIRETRRPVRMNSAEEISKYHDHNSHYCSPVLARRTLGTRYELPEKSPKKDKKWSLGSFFRRKKKPGSESSSEEDTENRILQKKKKKSDKRKKANKAVAFDHVVVSPASGRNSSGSRNQEDTSGIFSEPGFGGRSKNFIPASDYTMRFVPLNDVPLNGCNGGGSPSTGSLGRRKKEVVKARAAARRDVSKDDSSDDDDSQISMFKSDDSLCRHRDGSVSRRSRAARTQRYLKRRSKDEELHEPLRVSKSDMEFDHSWNAQHPRLLDERMQNMKSVGKSAILSATTKSKLSYTNSTPSSRPNFSGLSTIPPSHSSLNKYRTINLTNGVLSMPPSYDCNETEIKSIMSDRTQRSLSCGANIHDGFPTYDDEIVHVQFPLGKPFNKHSFFNNPQLNSAKRQPPPPPPRDPRRVFMVPNSDSRPISYSFENGPQSKNASNQQLNRPVAMDVNRNLTSCRSTSEDHISLEPSQRIPVVPRPSSATPETTRLQKMGRNLENGENFTGYRYLADKNPRSRKPISIQPCQVEAPINSVQPKSFEFWKQKDDEALRSAPRKSTPASPLMFTAQTHVRTNIFLPNGQNVETTQTTTQSDALQRESSPFRPITPTKAPSPTSDKSENINEPPPRKSSNLEDALDELEAIYNSLHLGDEDLLERAEQREAAAAQKRRDAAFEHFPSSVGRGAFSDSGFSCDLSFDSSRRKRYSKRPEPDRRTDDMAFRKLNKDRYNTINDPQSTASQVSYLLTSPVFNSSAENQLQKPKNKKEPDVTLDDVVYRNVKHTNNALKVVEPQPPFGIPVGPVLPASNSDYLHAMPENSQRFTFKPKKVPDVVKDDLAYRNLRKDHNKEPALPYSNFNPDDYLNNNSNKSGDSFKKKRAVRSLSANIFSMMCKDWKTVPSEDSEESQQNIGDVADALELARQILKEKEEKISATRQAFMSDSELKYRKYDRSSPANPKVNGINDKKSNSLDSDTVYHHKVQVNIPIINYDRLDAKPPTPDRSRRSSRPSKESTPIPSSPSEETQIKKQLQNSTLDDLLSSLCAESRSSSERNSCEMNTEGKERHLLENGFKENSPEELKKRSAEKLKELEEDAISTFLNLQLTDSADIDSTSEHTKLCEKLMECVVDGNELLAATKVETEPASEEVSRIQIEPVTSESVANVVLIPDHKSNYLLDPVPTEVFSESDHDYVNMHSPNALEKCEETEIETIKEILKSLPFENPHGEMESSTEIDEEKQLLQLDDDYIDVSLEKSEFAAALELLQLQDDVFNQLQETDTKQNANSEGEQGASVECISLNAPGCAFASEKLNNLGDETPQSHIAVRRFILGREGVSQTEELFRNSLGEEGNLESMDTDIWIKEALDSLKSPKLVLTVNEAVENKQLLDELETKLIEDLRGEYNEPQKVGVNLEQLQSDKLKNCKVNVGSDMVNVSKDLENSKNNATKTLAASFVEANEVALSDLKDVLSILSSLNKTPNPDFHINTHNTDSTVSVGIQKNLDSSVNSTSIAEAASQCDIVQNLHLRKNYPFTSTCFIKVNSENLDDSVSDLQQTDSPSLSIFKSSCKDENKPVDQVSTTSYAFLTRSATDDKTSIDSDKEESTSSENSDRYQKGDIPTLLAFKDTNSSEEGGSSSLSSNLRDSRHTLDRSQPSSSWYEDPATIALACSCGIACTTHLPSFDIITVLGLLFAVISLLIAFICRT